MIDRAIKKLICYAISKGLLDERDRIFATNKILELLRLDSFDCEEEFDEVCLEETLKELLDFAITQGIIEDTITHRDLFDTALMGALLPPPSVISNRFWELYERSPESATQFYYEFSQNSDYIRRYRIKKDMKWVSETPYGALDITINLSKPEKDPKAIAAAKNAKQSSYPKCLLCKECEGYAGRLNFPARQNHRIIPITINDSQWCLQYSPYVYYNEHCIVFNSEHTPMAINRATFKKLLDFVGQFPHYFVGSNADLPIVGGSILSHDHFQGGNYTFAMEKAPIKKSVTFKGFEDIECGIVKWPMSVIRISGKSRERLIDLADKILLAWRSYSDEKAFIFAYSGQTPHNTITPIARKKGENYELDLVLRNNITTDEHPLGVYHPHSELHHIKKENIGLIEVMGLAVLPARLKDELSLLEKAIREDRDIKNDDILSKHYEWLCEIKEKYSDLKQRDIGEILKDEVGIVFFKVLEHAGVYKCDEQGEAAFMRFIDSVV